MAELDARMAAARHTCREQIAEGPLELLSF